MAMHELTNDQMEILQDVSKDTGRPLNDLLTEALHLLLDKLEDHQDAEEAAQAYKEFKESGEKGIPMDDVLQELGFSRKDLE